MTRWFILGWIIASLGLVTSVGAQSDGGLPDSTVADADPSTLISPDAALPDARVGLDASAETDGSPQLAAPPTVDAAIPPPDAEIAIAPTATPVAPESPSDTDELPAATTAPPGEAESAPSPPQPVASPETRAHELTPSPIPLPSPSPTEEPFTTAQGDEDWESFLPELPSLESRTTWELFISLTLVLLLLWLVRRARDRLPGKGMIPRTLSLLSLAFRITVVFIAFLFLMKLVPEWMDPVMQWILLAAAAALGWSARDILPDLFAGLILTLERRVRVGVWISGEGFSGLVESRGPRAVHIRDAHGHTIAIPNRILLESPTLTDMGVGVGHEIVLRLPTEAPASLVRQALRDAALASPWVPPSVEPLVFRDTSDPDLWHLRCRLLEPSHALHFEGEILERTEEIIEYQRGDVN